MTKVKTVGDNGGGKKIKTAKQINDRRDLLFVLCLIAFPALQFIVFYIITNLNSFALAFQEYDPLTGFQWLSGDRFFDNFREIFNPVMDIQDHDIELVTTSLANSFKVYGINLLINVPVCILFSYYIFKEYMGHKMFKTVLFLPSIVSMLTLSMIFKYFADEALPEMIVNIFGGTRPEGLFANVDTRYGALMFIYIFFGLGTSMLMYVGAMSGIDQSTLEAAKIDGVGTWHEITHIVLPMIYPTIKTFLVCGIAAIFTDQFNLFNVYQANTEGKPYSTIGYYFYCLISAADGKTHYGYVAAFGLLISAILIPITIGINKLMDKLDPMN